MDNLKQVYDDETLYEVYDPSGVVRPAWTSARESALTSNETSVGPEPKEKVEPEPEPEPEAIKCIDPKQLTLITPHHPNHPFTSTAGPSTTAQALLTDDDDDDDDAPAHIANRVSSPPSRGNNHPRLQDSSTLPRHKKRRAVSLDALPHRPLYDFLPDPDREYFHNLVENLYGAPCFDSPQAMEPTAGSPAGLLLIGSRRGLLLVGSRRDVGVGAAADHESIYAVFVARPLKGAFVCWICGEQREDRKLPRAVGHIRGHFEHYPYHCSETHVAQQAEPESPSSLVSVCGQSFSCAEALKDHQVKMKNKIHACNSCVKVYTSSSNLNRHIKKEHSN